MLYMKIITKSWTKLRTVGPRRGYLRPLESWKNDALFLQTYFGRLVLYEPSTEQMTDLHIDREIRTMQAITYIENLVSLKQRRTGPFLKVIEVSSSIPIRFHTEFRCLDHIFCLLFSTDIRSSYSTLVVSL
ncbi:hypothetical protein I3842_07G025500 [Carya illinoinensis]|uniref:Uncharacterized protein n=1 Tax=Carya illinoinensis TaxID=32201 RepID=A0A922EHW6_CARIL|nr:hypothetical protein I3842_07G025500 [Carya illinoinensis]